MDTFDRFLVERRRLQETVPTTRAVARRIELGEDVPWEELDLLTLTWEERLVRSYLRLEEEMLLPWIARIGFPCSTGPVPLLIEEAHTLEKGVRRLRAMVAGKLGAPGFVARELRHLTQVLDQHLEREENLLFIVGEHPELAPSPRTSRHAP